MSESFELFPSRSESSQQMNRSIKAAFARSEGTIGTFARSGGHPTPSGEQRRERLSAALDWHDSATRAGDDAAVARAEIAVAEAIDVSREGRQEQARDDRPRDELGRYVSGFSGGARGRQPKPTPGGGTDESASHLLMRALTRSREDRLDSGAEDFVIAVNT